MTAEELGDVFGIQGSRIHQRDRDGKNTSSIGAIVAVAELFDVSIDSLLKENQEMGAPLADRPPSDNEVGRSQLIFSRFWDHLASMNIDQTNYKERSADVGNASIDLVSAWHQASSIEEGGNVDVSKSCYLTLSWSKDDWCQLHQFPLALVGPGRLTWMFPVYIKGGESYIGNHLRGNDAFGPLFEWYGESGGQLKYYPLVADAIWESARFRLEPLPSGAAHGVLHKAESYFPNQWAAASRA